MYANTKTNVTKAAVSLGDTNHQTQEKILKYRVNSAVPSSPHFVPRAAQISQNK
jgi:hypothetical protein